MYYGSGISFLKTWLAAYFVCVDTTLLVQYLYYNARSAKLANLPSHDGAIPRSPPLIRTERTPSRYRTISAVAANVAAAAALAAQHDEQGHIRHHVRRQRRNTTTLTEASRDGEPSTMMESFCSEGGHKAKQKRVSWSTERYHFRGASRSHLVSPDTARQVTGEDIDRLEDGPTTESPVEAPPSPTLAPRRSSRSSRKSTGLVLLGAGALFGFGGYASVGKGTSESSDSPAVGRVIGTTTANVLSTVPFNHLSQSTHTRQHASEVYVTFHDPKPTELDLPLRATANSRFLGRVFAWLCTTLYLTSRLPQIWKNVSIQVLEPTCLITKNLVCQEIRRGLIHVSFCVCILGQCILCRFDNTFTQILPPSSPVDRVHSRKCSVSLASHLPIQPNIFSRYLLGSGGTLTFDITIVTQFFIYRSRRPRHSLIQESLASEETALLSGTEPHYREQPPRGRTSHVKSAEDL